MPRRVAQPGAGVARTSFVLLFLCIVLPCLAATPCRAQFTGSLESLCPPSLSGLTLMQQFSLRDDPAYDTEIRFYTDQQSTYMITVVIMAWKIDVAAHQAMTPGDVDQVLQWPPAAAPDMAAEYDVVGGFDVINWPIRAIRMTSPCEVMGYITARDNVHVTITGGSLTCGSVDSDLMQAHAREAYEYILPLIPLPENAAPAQEAPRDSSGPQSRPRDRSGVGAMEVLAILTAALLLLGGGGVLVFKLAKPSPRPAPSPRPSPSPRPPSRPGPSLDITDPTPSQGPNLDFGDPPARTSPRIDFGDAPEPGQGPELQFDDSSQDQTRDNDRADDRDDDRDDDKEPQILELNCSVSVIRDKGPLSAELSARVLSPDMTPLPAQQVEFFSDHGEVAPKVSATGPRGGAAKARWSADERPRGDVRIWARHAEKSQLTDFKIMRRETDAPARLDIQAQRTKLRADGKDHCDLTFQVADAQGRPMEGVALEADAVAGHGSLQWLHKGGTTDASGQAWARYVAPDADSLDQEPGAARIAAHCRDHPQVAAAVDLEQEVERRAVRVDVAAAPDSLPPDNDSQARITATLLDRRDQTVPRRPLEFHTEPQDLAAYLTALRGITDDAGQVAVGLRLPRQTTGESVTVLARLEQGEEAPLEGRVSIQVERFQLTAQADKDRLRADGQDRAEITATLARSGGEPVSGEVVLAELPESKGQGSLEPANAVTDSQGRATMSYISGKESATISVVLSVQDREGLRAEVSITQQREDFFDIELKHHHMGPVLRLTKRPSASARHSGLTAADVTQVRVLANDRASDYGGDIPRDGWLLAALIMHCDCSPGSGYYAERAGRYAELAAALHSAAQALESMRARHESLADQATALETVKLVYEAVTLLPGGAGRVFTASCMSMVSTLLGWGESMLGAGDRVRDLARRSEWNGLTRQEVRLTRDAARASGDLAAHWADLGPDGGLEYKAELVLPGYVGSAANSAKALLDASAGLMALQVDKARLVAELGGDDQPLPANVLGAMDDLRAIREHRAEQWAEARAVRATAEALPALRSREGG